MAFSFRKMFSNMYFKKPEDEIKIDKSKNPPNSQSVMINFERKEPDSASIHSASLKLPNSVQKFVEKKGSLSDTDLLTISVNVGKEKRRKCKKLKLDIKKANQTSQQASDESFNVENTPRKLLLNGNHSDEFSERLKIFDFNKSFDLFDEMSDEHPSTPYDEDVNLDSFSECSESDLSPSNKIKMCRKVSGDIHSSTEDNQVISTSPESFADIEFEKNEEERLKLILNYQLKLEEIESLMKNLLKDYQYHVEISKTFSNKLSNSEKSLEDVYIGKSGPSPAESWSLISVKEEENMKYKLKKQLWSMKSYIEQFVEDNLEVYNYTKKCIPCKKTSNLNLGHKQIRNISKKKKVKYFDYPDIRDAMINLFLENDEPDSITQCECKCHEEPDSESAESSEHSFSISSSIGNFSLESSELTVFSESLDHCISYSSFDDTSLYNTLLQIPTVERIKFYIQVHSIEIKSKSETNETKVIFHCPPCKYMDSEEDGLLYHILTQSHCEKLHFLYKTAYIKKCMSTGKEIQPSTVLNPMTMYRDENKIVCFGDAIYACSLCFENNIVGESVLMTHCSAVSHIDRRDRLGDIIG